MSSTPVYIFVDNSNVWIRGKEVSGGTYNLPSNALYRLDYGKLVTHVLGDRPLGDPPRLYGSKPPETDTIWNAFRRQGLDVEVFERNVRNKEKGVDMRLSLDVSKVLHRVQEPATIALVAGDADYWPALSDAQEAGWRTEVWYWSQTAGKLREHADLYENLDGHVTDIGFEV